MKTTTKKILSIIAFASLSLSSCRRGDDLYISPNDPLKATPQTLLAQIEVATMNTFEGDLNRTASMLIQHNVGADGQGTEVQVYALSESSFDNQWVQVYQTLKNCQIMVTDFGSQYPYHKGITEVLTAMNLALLADLWGDVPYSNALGKESYPKYDSQEFVYEQVLKMLADAITDFSKPESANLALPGSEDFIYEGNIMAWKQAAHTLRARYMNRFSNKPGYKPNEILVELSQGIGSSADNMMAVHGPTSNESNQWYAFLNTRAYLVAAATLVDSMNLRPKDVRIYYYFDSLEGGAVVGSPIDEPDYEVSFWGRYLAGSSATPTPLVTYSEAKFIEAEVKARLGAANADALNEAIMASASEVTSGAYDGADIAVYEAGSVPLSRVMYEKWIAMFGQTEAYTDYRRTGMPALVPNRLGAISVIPQRYPTPQSERVNNPNAPVTDISDPVWFARQ